jgi:P4 family phage/plasmid primase-like protien
MSWDVTVALQLQNDSFGFCKVAKKDKKPFEKGWSKKPYKWNDPALQGWMKAGGNYGVIGGHGGLTVFDADALARLEELGIISQMPETFTVQTPGRGGMHFYYICPGLGKKMALYDPEETELDKQGKEVYKHVADLSYTGMQTVGPGSVRYFPGEEEEYRSYQIINNIPIAHITKEQLLEVIKVLRTSQKVEKEKVQGIKEPKDQQAGYNRWAETLKVEDVLLPDNITKDDREDSGEIQGSHPIHGSEGGHNFAINVKKNTWVCYRCTPPEGKGKKNCGGGPWELLGVREGILSCDDCYKGWRRDKPEKWAAVLRRAKELGLAVPRLPDGDSMNEYRRDIIRYCVEVIMGSEHVKTLKSGEILVYENGAYRFEGQTILESLIQQLGGPQTTNNVVGEVLGQIRRMTPADFMDFDRDPYRLSVKNGILNLKTGKLEPHNPEFLTVIQIPVEFKPEADCPKVKKFMSEIVKPEDVPLLEEQAGYCLLRAYPIHKAFVLLGGGDNGKSVWIKLIVAMVGLDHTSQVPFQKLGSKFKTAELKGKMINFYSDLPAQGLFFTDTFKMLTSEDPMSIEEKFLKSQTFINYAKLLFSANQLPKTYDESDGFYRRIILIDFPNKFDGPNRDEHLLEKLTTPEELSGFLNLAIAGLNRLLKNHKFTYAKTLDDVRADYKKKSTPGMAIKDFIDQATLTSVDGFIPRKDLWSAYLGWCLETGEDPVSQGDLKMALEMNYGVNGNYHPWVEKAPGIRERVWAYRGLFFTEEGVRLKNLGLANNPLARCPEQVSGQTLGAGLN